MVNLVEGFPFTIPILRLSYRANSSSPSGLGHQPATLGRCGALTQRKWSKALPRRAKEDRYV